MTWPESYQSTPVVASYDSAMLADQQRQDFDRDGYVVAGQLIERGTVDALRERFDRVFAGEFETGVIPDEVNWQRGSSDKSVTRQICDGW